MEIRLATTDDYEALRAIYNYEVENACNNFDTKPASPEQWEVKMQKYNKPGLNNPLLVADDNGVICGYACLSPFRAKKDGYAPSKELSIYVDANQRGRGLGNTLMDAIVAEGRKNPEIHAIISVITTNNAPSQALHQKFGFEHCGTIRQVAFKMGEYHDISYFELFV